MKTSTGLWNYILSQGSLKAALAGGEIRIYAGTEPARADDSIGAAVLLCTIKNGGSGINFEAAAADRSLNKAAAETWSGTNVAGGQATFYRHVLAADSGAASLTALRMQGTVGAGNGDLNLGSTTLVNGAPCPVAYYSVSGSAR